MNGIGLLIMVLVLGVGGIMLSIFINLYISERRENNDRKNTKSK